MTSNMHTYIERAARTEVLDGLRANPAVVLLGPRQSGKTTLARSIVQSHGNSLYLDLERPTDTNRLRDPEAFLSMHTGKLVCVDEVQRVPSLFPTLRALIDERRRNGRFLLLGSATPDLLRQSAESLAGRISYVALTPFLCSEVSAHAGRRPMPMSLWLRGGFPPSFLAHNDQESYRWREDLITTFLERDMPALGFRVPAEHLHRLWSMVAHVSGHVLNASALGSSLGVSHHTVRSYLDMLTETFMVRILPPFFANLKKRLVKSPKCFVRDTGLLHVLLGVPDRDALYGHPAFGASWESFAVEQIVSAARGWRASYYRSSTGNELDLVLERGRTRVAVECKSSSAPRITRGCQQALSDIGATKAWIAAPVSSAYPVEQGITVASPQEIVDQLARL